MPGTTGRGTPGWLLFSACTHWRDRRASSCTGRTSGMERHPSHRIPDGVHPKAATQYSTNTTLGGDTWSGTRRALPSRGRPTRYHVSRPAQQAAGGPALGCRSPRSSSGQQPTDGLLLAWWPGFKEQGCISTADVRGNPTGARPQAWIDLAMPPPRAVLPALQSLPADSYAPGAFHRRAHRLRHGGMALACMSSKVRCGRADWHGSAASEIALARHTIASTYQVGVPSIPG